MKKALAPVSSPSSSRPSVTNSSSVAGFGTNEWLVEEMYQQYLSDPSSVDQAWHEFFADYRPGSPVGGGDREAPAQSPDGSTRAQQRTATAQPAPAPSPDSPALAAAPTDARPEKAAQAQRPPPPARRERPPGAGPPHPRAQQPQHPQPRKPQPEKPQPAPAAKPSEGSAAKPAARPAAKAPAAGAKQIPLRGAAASVVKNMNASLTVPTATSVRAVPAKLLADNRIVINNHLARSRGGKVSFTHLIGYALVRALDDFPNMNSAFAEVDGKPTLVQPEHVNFGLAIDLPKADGSRSLVVASIKAAEEIDFAQFWGAY